MTPFLFRLRQLFYRMWFLPAAFSAVAVATIALALYLARWAPEELPFTISQQAVQSILEILATSLLTVSVFALSTLVGALSSASASTTPRAVPLIAGDRAAQTSISVFIGAFLFSILAILGLSAGIYGSASRMLLFAVTLGVVGIVIIALIRWIGQISDIGRVTHTIDRVETATSRALARLVEQPFYGCTPLVGQPEGAPVFAEQIGYVQHFDATHLQKVAEEHQLRIAISALPGTYVSSVRPLLLVTGEVNDKLSASLRDAFVVGDERSFEDDPGFGLLVLSEIADRALSPGVNDPGTAIDVLGRLARILARWQPAHGNRDPEYDRVALPSLDPRDLVEDTFRPIARDGAGTIEVVRWLLHSLEVVANSSPTLRDAAVAAASDAVTRAEQSLQAPGDLAALRAAARFN